MRFVASHSLQPLSPSAMALGIGCPWLGWSCSVEPWCSRMWAAADEAAGAHLGPTLGFLPPLSWLQGSLSVHAPPVPTLLRGAQAKGISACCSHSQAFLRGKPWALVLLVCAGTAASSARTSVAGHELIFMTLHTAV